MSPDPVKAALSGCSGYENKSRVKKDARHIMKEYPSMKASVANVRFSSGQMSGDVLRLDGTVPINFRGREYHTPVSIIFFKLYPAVPPFICVCPTQDMQIRQGHGMVQSNGVVMFSKIEEFNKKSDIMELMKAMIERFGDSPPLFKRPQGPPAQRHPAGSVDALNAYAGQGGQGQAMPPYPPPPAQGGQGQAMPPYPPPPALPPTNPDANSEPLPAAAEPEHESNECKICFEEIEEGNVAVLAPCGHTLCLSCANEVKRRNGLCPYCKTRISQVVKLFKM